MMKQKIVGYVVALVFAVFSFPVSSWGQSNGDKLFMEGQNLQKVMTVASQNAAIKKFRAAKIVYTNASNKTMCDNQIAICNNNLKTLSKGGGAASTGKKRTTTKGKTTGNEAKKGTETPAAEVPKATKRNVKLSLSESRLDFKATPNEGATQSVDVDCNYNDWAIKSKPDWITVYTTKDKFSVEAQENATGEDRSGVVTVKCGDKEVDLVVNQNKESAVNKVVGKIGGIFKKKKKK